MASSDWGYDDKNGKSSSVCIGQNTSSLSFPVKEVLGIFKNKQIQI